MPVTEGLSFGVLKAQEFQFRSKLTHPQAASGPQDIDPCSIRLQPILPQPRSRAYSLPSVQQAPVLAGVSDVSGPIKCAPYQAPVPLDYYEVNQQTWPPKGPGLSTIKEEINPLVGNAHVKSRRSTRDEQHAAKLPHPHPPRPVARHRDHFMWGDPHSDRLSEFVSRMVSIIFWSGTETYTQASDIFSSKLPPTPDYKATNHPALSQVRFPSSHMPSELCAMFQPTTEFIQYTKWLLETMQISCSTGLLALFYLHRLRPNVKHLFVPGTFDPLDRGDSSLPATPPRYQYRRDPKLEYRLFTIALILANKYLDDHSFSNRAWSDVTGLDLRKINVMELEFMKYINYNLWAKEKEYVVWIRWLESFIAPVSSLPTRPPPTAFGASVNRGRRASISQADLNHHSQNWPCTY